VSRSSRVTLKSLIIRKGETQGLPPFTANYVPVVANTEVDRFYRDLRQTVVNLENAYRKEILPVYLPRVDVESQFGTALFNVYWRLIRRPFIKDPQRRRLREYIRQWVHSDAIRSTKALRQWEADVGTFQRRYDGRLIARSNSISSPHR